MRFLFNWVLVDEIAVGSCPINEGDVIILKKRGIKSILSLCSEDEVYSKVRISDHFNHKRFILPDHKKNFYPTKSEILTTLNFLNDLKQLGPVFVHCVASVERSPLICMAWLIKDLNLSPEESLDYMMQIHPSTNPLPQQFSLLKDLK